MNEGAHLLETSVKLSKQPQLPVAGLDARMDERVLHRRADAWLGMNRTNVTNARRG